MRQMSDTGEIRCFKCNKKLEEREVCFQYLGRELFYKVLSCPECGQVFIPESLAKGKMKQVETMIEGK